MLALAAFVAGVASQEPNAEAAPEPYSYGYETDSHAASEQRDPNGKVTGFYTLVDADGRQRRVEYFADESGFHAKVQTNEVGTKSANSADVEVLAAPPTPEQFVYQAQPQAAPQVQLQQQRVVSQQVSSVAQPYRATSGVQYVQQPGSYGYGYNYPGYGYGYNYPGYGYGYNSGYNNVVDPYRRQLGYGVSSLGVGNYNNHLPSQYYRNVQAGPSYGLATNGARYVTSNVASVPATSAGYRQVGVPSSVSYGTAGQSVAGGYTSGVGSSNYLVLKKRETEN